MAQGDLKNPDNAINRFVAYHFMQGRMAYDRFVHHYNEYGYKYGDNKKPQTNNLPVNVWDYYATIGKYRGLIKSPRLVIQVSSVTSTTAFMPTVSPSTMMVLMVTTPKQALKTKA